MAQLDDDDPCLAPDFDQIEEIRRVSRILAREWGFMGGGFAGTELSPSAVHALIEIDRDCKTARELGLRLSLEKSSVSRMLRRLIEAGDVSESAGDNDARIKHLSLTEAGKARMAGIDDFARRQVREALSRLEPGDANRVAVGLHLYAKALGPSVKAAPPVPPVRLIEGYQSGLIARITEMNMRYYAREAAFGQRFESVVASGMADLCNRLDNPRNAIWAAMSGDRIVGSIAIDGEDMGDGIAHLRCFIVDDAVRGTGAGRKLLSAALAFVDAHDFAETHLWTFKGLSAARHLYDSLDFELAEERLGTQWGKEVMEQRFVRFATASGGNTTLPCDDFAPPVENRPPRGRGGL